MCATSAIIREFMTQYPPVQHWPQPLLIDAQEIIRRLDALDKKIGAKDCYEPTKADFLKSLDDRLKKLEAATSPQP